jgi:hypothetical protein
MIDKNMRAIADAKRHSAEITRCLAKNIISTKQNLEVQLDDFAMFFAKVKDCDAELLANQLESP